MSFVPYVLILHLKGFLLSAATPLGMLFSTHMFKRPDQAELNDVATTRFNLTEFTLQLPAPYMAHSASPSVITDS